MKKLLLLAVALMLGANLAFADVTINLLAGVLSNNSGTAIPSGSLLQLVVDDNQNGFTLPTPTSFTGGSDDGIVASFASNSFGGGNGETSNSVTFSLGSGVDAGDPLMLRWWPTLTTSSSSPGSGTMFGQFTTTQIENGSDTAWVVPSDGATIALNFETTSFGGTEPDTSGRASLTVAAVPEPPTFAIGALGAAGLLALIRRKKK